VGVVFQEQRLLEHLSAYDNVAVRLRLAGAPEEWASAQVSPLLAWLGLGEVLERKVPALAPGERQLVALARAAVGRPALVLADEPFAGLDSRQAERALRLLMALQRQGATVVVATRDEALPARHPFRVLRLEDGRLADARPRGLRLTA
jgi:cell division transport system ATP-binding protein